MLDSFCFRILFRGIVYAIQPKFITNPCKIVIDDHSHTLLSQCPTVAKDESQRVCITLISRTTSSLKVKTFITSPEKELEIYKEGSVYMSKLFNFKEFTLIFKKIY